MLTDFEDWAEDTQAVIPALTAFLWWGIAVRGVLLFALATLWVVEGNFLAEWLLSWDVVPVGPAEVEEYSAIGYAAFVLFLTAGTIARAATLRRLRRPPRRPSHAAAPPAADDGSSASADATSAEPDEEPPETASTETDERAGSDDVAEAERSAP